MDGNNPHAPVAATQGATNGGSGRRWRDVPPALRGHPELLALAAVLVGLVVRPRGALGTAWWGGTAVGSAIALVAVLRRGGGERGHRAASARPVAR